ncbi:MAG: MerR family transcriptional regulator [Chloroflexi bacterium]|nr:MerR family transcriptional regulator [Chloroflexota bacterium]
MNYTIGAVSQQLGVSPGALRAWEKDGLIPKPKRQGVKKMRIYNDQEVKTIREFIKDNYN